MKKLWIVALLGLFIVGITGCREDEASSAESMLKDVTEHPDVQVPKDHPAH